MKFDTYFYINNTKNFYLDNINTIEHFLEDLEGPQGNTGNRGYTGPRGLQGLQGRRGIIGRQGVKGNIGLQGYRGRSGYDGVEGGKGEDGVKGLNGYQGFIGKKGKYGPRGTPGPKGYPGVDGLIGRQGYSGNKGLKGDNGDNGIKIPKFGRKCVNKVITDDGINRIRSAIIQKKNKLNYGKCNALTIDKCLDDDCKISEGQQVYNFGPIYMTGFGKKLQPMVGQATNPIDKRFTAPYRYIQNSNKQMKCPPNSYLTAFGYARKGANTTYGDWCTGGTCKKGFNRDGDLQGSKANQWNNMRPGMPYVYSSDCAKLL